MQKEAFWAYLTWLQAESSESDTAINPLSREIPAEK